jgi:hypothetical protein
MTTQLIDTLWLLPAVGFGVLVALVLGRCFGGPTAPRRDEPALCGHAGCESWLCKRRQRDWDTERLPRELFGGGSIEARLPCIRDTTAAAPTWEDRR